MMSLLFASGGGGGAGAIGHATTAGGVIYFTFALIHIVRIFVAWMRHDKDKAVEEWNKVEDEYKFRS